MSVNPETEKYLTQEEYNDVHEAMRRMNDDGAIGDVELKRRLHALIIRLSDGEKVLPDFDEHSAVIKDKDLTQPFKAPDPSDDVARKAGAPRAGDAGLLTPEARRLVDERYEKVKKHFGVKHEVVLSTLYHAIEGQIVKGDDKWQDWFLDAQQEYVEKAEQHNGVTEWTKNMRNYIAKERRRRQKEQAPPGGKRSFTDQLRPTPWPSQSNMPRTEPIPEGAVRVCAGTERFE